MLALRVITLWEAEQTPGLAVSTMSPATAAFSSTPSAKTPPDHHSAKLGATRETVCRQLMLPHRKQLRLLWSQDIKVYDWQRETMTRLNLTNGFFPVWTSDGKHVAFSSQSPGAGSIRWIRADGAGEAQLLVESKVELRPYSFSPNGQRLAFAEVGGNRAFDLWTLPLDVSDPEHPLPCE